MSIDNRRSPNRRSKRTEPSHPEKQDSLNRKGPMMADKGKRDKGKREEQKRGKQTLKEKRRQKRDDKKSVLEI
jgi:hypothetical protein